MSDRGGGRGGARARGIAAVLAVALAFASAPALAPELALAQSDVTATTADEQFDGISVEPQASLPDIEDEVMCPICGVSLELAIEAPQAQQEREFIRELIAQGLTKDQILDRLVAEFGSEVLAVPGTSGFDLAAWLVPGAAILVAGGAIVVGLRRWRRNGARGGPDSPGPGAPGESLDAAETARLDEDLARYRL